MMRQRFYWVRKFHIIIKSIEDEAIKEYFYHFIFFIDDSPLTHNRKIISAARNNKSASHTGKRLLN